MQLPLRPFPVKRLHIPLPVAGSVTPARLCWDRYYSVINLIWMEATQIHLGSFPRSLGWSEKFWAAAAQQGDDGYEQQQ